MEMLMALDDSTRLELAQLIKEAVQQTIDSHPLNPDELQWVRMAIKAEAERAELRKAVIHKSLAGLVWMMLAGAGAWLVDFVSSHWK
tara:strand:- start:358 stop:618 length:261 start_codon:yes stop_codon:yes gene_type:complete